MLLPDDETCYRAVRSRDLTHESVELSQGAVMDAHGCGIGGCAPCAAFALGRGGSRGAMVKGCVLDVALMKHVRVFAEGER